MSCRYISILEDNLSCSYELVSKKINTSAIVLPKVTLSFMKNMGCFMQLGKVNHKIPEKKSSEKIMDNYFESIFDSLKSDNNILIGTLSFANYDTSIWERASRPNRLKIKDPKLIQVIFPIFLTINV